MAVVVTVLNGYCARRRGRVRPREPNSPDDRPIKEPVGDPDNGVPAVPYSRERRHSLGQLQQRRLSPVIGPAEFVAVFGRSECFLATVFKQSGIDDVLINVIAAAAMPVRTDAEPVVGAANFADAGKQRSQPAVGEGVECDDTLGVALAHDATTVGQLLRR